MTDLSPPLTATQTVALGGPLVAVPGLVGPPGPSGSNGTRIFISAGVIPAYDNNPQTGDIFITTTAFSGFAAWTVFSYNMITNIWGVVGTITGATGATGPAGPQGPIGPVGGLALATVPSTASSTGVQGQIAVDSSYVYLCVATNTWKRSALSSW